MIIVLLLISLFINTIFSICGTCLENQTYIWGIDEDNNMVPNTSGTCWGILNCNNALCSITRVINVTSVIIQPTLKTTSFETPLDFTDNGDPGTCTEGQTFLIGLYSNYTEANNAARTCWGLFSCNNMICDIKNIPQVSFIVAIPING